MWCEVEGFVDTPHVNGLGLELGRLGLRSVPQMQMQMQMQTRGRTQAQASRSALAHTRGVNRPSCAIQPPSTRSECPVTYDDASDARNSTGPAISWRTPHRPSVPFSA